MKKLQRTKMSLLLLTLAVIFGVLLWPEMVFAWGDSNGVRAVIMILDVIKAILITILIVALLICVFQMFWSKIKQRRLRRKINRLNNDLCRPESLLEEKED